MESLKQNFRTDLWAVRTWSSFFEKAAFQMPKPNECYPRMEANLDYYRANYVIIVGVIFLLLIYLNPVYLPVLALIAVSALGLILVDPLKFQGHTFSFMEKMGILTTESIFILWLANCFGVFGWSFGLSSGGVLAHAALRKPSLKSKVTNFMSDVKRG